MRILQVRFRNLNSLLGEWLIDLTDPSYISDGIFAITGPTGAGKTTILDAICLALYGHTPRLDRVTKGANEIMSRQTGECFAEVTFETSTGRFRCHWSQHRSRRKAGGELQAPRHEISNADTGEIFESSIKGVADQIVAVTGMDFERFTRSMLLAQGGFAAFLQAAPDERAPILEQITGTGIYSQISIRVHERRTAEHKQLELLQAELAGMQFLSVDEEQQFREALQQKAEQEIGLNRRITEENQAISWMEGIAGIEEELKGLGGRKQEAEAKREAFAPDMERLRLAGLALELGADHSAMEAIRRQQLSDTETVNGFVERLPGLNDNVIQAEKALLDASEQLSFRKYEQQSALPVIKKARELDLKLSEKAIPIKREKDTLAELATQYQNLNYKQKSDYEELQTKRNSLAELHQLLAATEADGRLVESLSAIKGRFSAMREINARMKEKVSEKGKEALRLNAVSGDFNKLSAGLEKARQGLELLRRDLLDKQSGLERLLDGQEISAWRERAAQLSMTESLLIRGLDSVRQLMKSKQSLEELDALIKTMSQQLAALESSIISQTDRQLPLERELELLETQLMLLNRIEDLGEARGQLQDGEPCPLCGSREHPFAAGNIPTPDDTRQRLDTVRSDLKSLRDFITDLKVKQARAAKELESAGMEQKEHGGRIEEATGLLNGICCELPAWMNLSVELPDIAEKLEAQKDAAEIGLSRVQAVIEVAERVEKEVAGLRDSHDKAKDAASAKEAERLSAIHNMQIVEQSVERLNMEAGQLRSQIDDLLAALETELEPFGISSLEIERLDTAFERLNKQREQWISRKNETVLLEQKVSELDILVRHQAEQLVRIEDNRRKQQDSLAILADEERRLRQERNELFADKVADDEENRLYLALEVAEKRLEEERKRLELANQDLSRLQARLDELQKTVAVRELQIFSVTEAFCVRLAASGFADEASYLSAVLPEAERKGLAMKAQRLSDELTEIKAREQEKRELLEVEREKKLGTEPLQEHKDRLAVMLGEQRELQQEIGGIRQRLNDNATLRERQQERLFAMESRRSECRRWDQLHDLIGSADGKKFRNFAQGLTFEMMLGHANRQLSRMTDRYLLVRDDSRPLELNVLDNYQAAAVRSTKNLSGGESFIVSLSLALGLSQMASRNVRVDSLFLDEGFGTLDEEALETALDTLAALQQEGKLIGVISHVQALKERIGTQIQVIPKSGGKSLLAGPGCQQVDY